MCTLSWKPTAEGYLLHFNRDEQRTRPPALPPALRRHNGVDFLAPIDAAHGGTWLLTNAHGLSIGLLNHYPATPLSPAKKRASRGLLPLACSDCTSAAEAVGRCAGLPLTDYPPFHFVAIDLRVAARLTWDGHAPRIDWLDPAGAMLTTSSFQPDLIARARHTVFTQQLGDIADATPAQLEAFHRHRGDDPAASVRMARIDACTHNISRIVVSRENTRFSYEPQPDLPPAGPCITLDLPLRLFETAR
ncbi:MAG: NRDE family protein [Thiobacillus sp.]|nr:NRDE family protein [Thiobacillus sp.]